MINKSNTCYGKLCGRKRRESVPFPSRLRLFMYAKIRVIPARHKDHTNAYMSAYPASQVVFKARVFSGIASYPQGRQGKSRTNEMFKPLMTRGVGHLVSHRTHATQGKPLHFFPWYNSFQKFGALSLQVRILRIMETDHWLAFWDFMCRVFHKQ